MKSTVDEGTLSTAGNSSSYCAAVGSRTFEASLVVLGRAIFVNESDFFFSFIAELAMA